MTSPLLLDQLAAQHRSDLLAEVGRSLPRRTPPVVLRARAALLSLRAAFATGTGASTSRARQVCCA